MAKLTIGMCMLPVQLKCAAALLMAVLDVVTFLAQQVAPENYAWLLDVQNVTYHIHSLITVYCARWANVPQTSRTKLGGASETASKSGQLQQWLRRHMCHGRSVGESYQAERVSWCVRGTPVCRDAPHLCRCWPPVARPGSQPGRQPGRPSLCPRQGFASAPLQGLGTLQAPKPRKRQCCPVHSA